MNNEIIFYTTPDGNKWVVSRLHSSKRSRIFICDNVEDCFIIDQDVS
ncbi:MAG: hypothetical protein IEMM0007_0189 [bacterium]|nr:MAG: hypothetical protein IEMM0007_0189 [bacterium]